MSRDSVVLVAAGAASMSACPSPSPLLASYSGSSGGWPSRGSSPAPQDAAHKDDAAAGEAAPVTAAGKQLLACVGVLAVVLCWVAKSALVQGMQTDSGSAGSSTPCLSASLLPPSQAALNATLDAVSAPLLLSLSSLALNCTNGTSSSTGAATKDTYEKPFFLAYTNGSSYAIFLFVFCAFHTELTKYFCRWIVADVRRRAQVARDAVYRMLGRSQQQEHRPVLLDREMARSDAGSFVGAGGDEDSPTRDRASSIGGGRTSSRTPPLYSSFAQKDPHLSSSLQSGPGSLYPDNSTHSFLGGVSAGAVHEYEVDDGSSLNGGLSSSNSLLHTQHTTQERFDENELQERKLHHHHHRSSVSSRDHASAKADAEWVWESPLDCMPPEHAAMVPTYARSVRAAFMLSFVYQLCGWMSTLSLSYTSLSVNTSIWNSGCALVFLMEGFFLPGHSLKDVQKLLSVVVCLGGVGVITLASAGKKDADSSSSDSSTPTTFGGVLCVMGAMLIYSAYEVIFKYVSEPHKDAPHAAAVAGGDSPSNAAMADDQAEKEKLNPQRGNDDVVRRSSSDAAEEVAIAIAPAPATAAAIAGAAEPDASAADLAPAPLPLPPPSSPMQSIWSALLFLGSMGTTCLLFNWVGIVLLDWWRIEEWVSPPWDDLRVILITCGLDCLLNISILISIALSSALFVQCGILLTIPTSMVWDRIAHNASTDALSMLGVALLILGFLGLNLRIPCLAKKEVPAAVASTAGDATTTTLRHTQQQESKDVPAQAMPSAPRPYRPPRIDIDAAVPLPVFVDDGVPARGGVFVQS